MNNPHTAWHPSDWERAKELKREGLSIQEIADDLGVTFNRVHSKFAAATHRERDELGIIKTRNGNPTAKELADREDRERAAQKRTQTQFLCGDPPPGFSALDKRERQP